MPGDLYYQTAALKALRAACVARDGNRCPAPGCTSRGRIADNIKPRKHGGPDTLANLRILCARCDNRRHADKAGTPRKRAEGRGWLAHAAQRLSCATHGRARGAGGDNFFRAGPL